jgi:hypothetical protein
MRRLHAMGLLAPFVGVAIACGTDSHLYQGRLFREERACLASTTALDVVEGDGVRICGPICLSQPHADGGRSIYVSSECGPFPYLFDASSSDPACGPALDALGRSDSCLSDGGSSNPLPRDAATD